MKSQLMTLLLLISIGIGCGNGNELEQTAEKNEADIQRLLNGAKKIKKTAESAKKEALLAVDIADTVIAKVDSLLNVKPEPKKPDPVEPEPKKPDPVEPKKPEPKKPDPVEPPKPTPDSLEPDDDRFLIAKASYRRALKVDSPERQAECLALSRVFKSVAAQVAAGGLNGSTIEPQWYAISSALAAGNRPVMKKNFIAWKPAAEELSAGISDRYAKDLLGNNQDWTDLLNAIGDALERASRATKE